MKERIGNWGLVLCIAVGTAAIVLAIVPGSWPNPLATDEGALAPADAATRLEPAAAAVDAACREGDGFAFASATTASYRDGLQQRLAAVDGALDGDTLKAMAAAPRDHRSWLEEEPLAAHVRGSFVGLAVARPQGDGAQVLVFRWQGDRFQLDAVQHAPRVETAAAAKRFLIELLRQR